MRNSRDYSAGTGTGTPISPGQRAGRENAGTHTEARKAPGVLDLYGLVARSDSPCFPPVLPVSLGSPLVPSGPSGVSLDPPVCPPVPLVSLGSYSGIGIVQL
jgi:hypothetical protein